MGIRLAVVSDAPSREAWLRIYHLNLHHLFDVVVTYNDTKKFKPSPEPFKRAIKLLNVKAEKCLTRDEAQKILIKANKAQSKINF